MAYFSINVCDYLLAGLEKAFEAIKWKNFFGERDILLTIVTMDIFESVNNTQCRPLYVIPPSERISQYDLKSVNFCVKQGTNTNPTSELI